MPAGKAGIGARGRCFTESPISHYRVVKICVAMKAEPNIEYFIKFMKVEGPESLS